MNKDTIFKKKSQYRFRGILLLFKGLEEKNWFIVLVIIFAFGCDY